MDLDRIKHLRKKGIITEAGYIRAKIINRFESLNGSDSKANIYFKLSQEFHLSEGRIKNIVTEYYRR